MSSTHLPMEEPPSVRPEVQLLLQAMLEAMQAQQAATQQLWEVQEELRRLLLTPAGQEALEQALAEWRSDPWASRPTSSPVPPPPAE
jgi:hypothetical protein